MWLQMFLIIFKLVLVITGLLILLLTSLVIHGIWLERRKGVCRCKTKLNGKTVLITGGNSGIGFETAKDLAKRGARVIIASRDADKSKQAVAEIKAFSGNENVEYRHLDLAKSDNVKEFANNFNKEFDKLDILVNNAGCSRVPNIVTKDGIDLLMQINYVGPFVLTNMLLDKLKAAKSSRIVIVSSYLHTLTRLKLNDITNCESSSYITQFLRYSKTKLCDILWTRELAKRLPPGITVNVLHPGLVKTNIFDALHPVHRWLIIFITDLFFKTAQEGAQTSIHLCVAPELENLTGGYYKDCKLIQPSKFAMDDKLAENLWNKTMSLI